MKDHLEEFANAFNPGGGYVEGVLKDVDVLEYFYKQHTSRTTLRPALQGVYCCPLPSGGVVFVAAGGTTLALFYSKHSELSGPVCLPLLKFKGRAKNYFISLTDGKIEYLLDDLRVQIPQVKMDFPPIAPLLEQLLLPTPETASNSWLLSPECMARFSFPLLKKDTTCLEVDVRENVLVVYNLDSKVLGLICKKRRLA